MALDNFDHALLSDYLALAERAARTGGELLMDYLGQLNKTKQVRAKSAAGDLVTAADLASEQTILQLLQAEVPDHGILAEESGRHAQADSPWLWAIDPLDGTLNFAHEVPFFCVSIALLYHNQPVVGVVYAPRLNECFSAQKAGPALLNGQPLQVSEVDSLQQGFLATGFPYRKGQMQDNNYREFIYFANRCQDVRRPGSAALDLCYVAAGRFDGFWERHLNAWDVCAGAVLVEAAGGKVSAYSGGPLDPFNGEILASNGHLHSTLSAGLQEVAVTAPKLP